MNLFIAEYKKMAKKIIPPVKFLKKKFRLLFMVSYYRTAILCPSNPIIVACSGSKSLFWNGLLYKIGLTLLLGMLMVLFGSVKRCIFVDCFSVMAISLLVYGFLRFKDYFAVTCWVSCSLWLSKGKSHPPS